MELARAERDRLIRATLAKSVPSRTVAAWAGLSHEGVRKIARRKEER